MAYERNGEWGGFEITEAKTGWAITSWSRRQGDMDGKKVLVPFGTWGFTKGQDLSADHNGWMDVGEAMKGMAGDNPEAVKVLRKGHKVN